MIISNSNSDIETYIKLFLDNIGVDVFLICPYISDSLFPGRQNTDVFLRALIIMKITKQYKYIIILTLSGYVTSGGGLLLSPSSVK